jgi:hypothetical protein
MCTPEKRIKFCTCKSASLNRKSYWILHRLAGRKELVTIGDAVMLSVNSNDHNIEKVQEALNSGLAFDKPFKFRSKDVFVLYLEDRQQVFAFQYLKKAWHIYEKYDVFDLMNKYDEIQQGLIKNMPEAN